MVTEKTMSDKQNYQNHTRWFPLVHFVIFPLLTVNLVWAIVCVIMEFDWYRLQFLLLSFTAVLMALAARAQSLRAQDRLIRLEERLRYRELLSPELAATASDFRVRQMIALRFASDEELPALAERIAAGELTEPKEIKMAIKNWRADHFRV
jgi:nitrate reductase NapE component